MTPSDLEKIKNWGKNRKLNRSIVLAVSADERSKMFDAFCTEFGQNATGVLFKKERTDDNPAIKISKRITYYAIPTGAELDPFLNALSLYETVSDTFLNQASDIPVLLKLFISSQCMYCPKVVHQLIHQTFKHHNIYLTIIDAILFHEMAAPYDIRSVPTLILDDDFRWTGDIRMPEVLEAIRHRDPIQMTATSLENMIQEGNAGKLADIMVKKNKMIASFPQMLIHEKWHLRLGAMVAMEIIIQQNRELAVQILKFFQNSISQLQDTIIGDLIYLYGETGEKEFIPLLNSLTTSQNPDIQSMAKEAIDRIYERKD